MLGAIGPVQRGPPVSQMKTLTLGFLVADSRLYERVCPSIHLSVHRFIHWSLTNGQSVTHESKSVRDNIVIFGQWPQRGRSPVEDRGTFVRPSVCSSVH